MTTSFAKRVEHEDKIESVSGADPRFTVRRRLVGYAYPRNGNVHNPSPQFHWDLLVDGQVVDSSHKRAPLVEAAQVSGTLYLADVDGRAIVTCDWCNDEVAPGQNACAGHAFEDLMGTRPKY